MSSYSLEELTAEKIRALYERCRPRDLYDVIHLYKNPNLIGVARTVKVLLEAKCQYVGIDFPTPASVKTDENKRDLVSDWNDMLAHQLPPPLLDWEPFWDEIDLVFDWLNGASTPISLPPAPHDAIPSTLLDASALNFSRSGINMQLLRYSALNRLKIVIYYEPTNGEIGPRKIEPYSLRETKDRKVLLFAVNGEGELRSYRLDRIHGMSPTNTKYVPRYKVEIG